MAPITIALKFYGNKGLEMNMLFECSECIYWEIFSHIFKFRFVITTFSADNVHSNSMMTTWEYRRTCECSECEYFLAYIQV
jgi:hypothetical protein